MAIAVLDIRRAAQVPGAMLMRPIVLSAGVCSLLFHLSEQGAVHGTLKIADPLIQPSILVVSTARPIVKEAAEELGRIFSLRVLQSVLRTPQDCYSF